MDAHSDRIGDSGDQHCTHYLAVWYMSNGWKFKDAEPSDAALFMGRLGGIIGTILGLIVLFGGLLVTMRSVFCPQVNDYAQTVYS